MCDLILFYGLYDLTPYYGGMISRNPMGTDICPYDGCDDELVTTKHPRDPKGTLVLCMQETLAIGIVYGGECGGTMHIRN